MVAAWLVTVASVKILKGAKAALTDGPGCQEVHERDPDERERRGKTRGSIRGDILATGGMGSRDKRRKSRGRQGLGRGSEQDRKSVKHRSVRMHGEARIGE